MSQDFNNGQHVDFSPAQSDRLQQFGAPENGNRTFVDMANPTEARLADPFARTFGQNGEKSLPNSGQFVFDDPFASAVGHGGWDAQKWTDSFQQAGAAGGAEHSYPNERQMEHELHRFERDSAKLLSFLEKYEDGYNPTSNLQGDALPADTAAAPPDDAQAVNASINPQGDAQPANTSTNPPGDAQPAATATNGGGSSITKSGTGSDNPNPIVTPNPSAGSSSAPEGTAGDGRGFQVNNGKITYDGQTLAGVNVSSAFAQNVGAQEMANEVSSELPGINVVRLETSPDGGAYSADIPIQKPQSTADIQADIQALNAKGIGVIIDNHSADVNNANNVSQDGDEPQWFATLAQQNLGNNGVMFQTQNEPTGSNQDIENEQVSVYNAVRATGSNNVVAFDFGGGDSAAPQLSDPSAYDSMSNYVFDAHAYVADANPISDMQYEAGQAASLKEANGRAVPVYFGETGNSLDGQNIQSAADQLLQTEFTDGNGAVAFGFDHAAFGLTGSGPADNMTDDSGNLNAYGQYVASLIKQSSSASSG